MPPCALVWCRAKRAGGAFEDTSGRTLTLRLVYERVEGEFRLFIGGLLGAGYRIQGSTSLRNWSDLAAGAANFPGTFRITNAVDQPGYFFQAVTP